MRKKSIRGLLCLLMLVVLGGCGACNVCGGSGSLEKKVKEKKYEDAKENFLVVKLFYGIFIIYGKCRHDCKS